MDYAGRVFDQVYDSVLNKETSVIPTFIYALYNVLADYTLLSDHTLNSK